MKIITNTASSLTREEGRKLGISIIPVSVSLGNRSLRDYIDINSDDYVKLLHGDEMPASSQPTIGDMIDELENLEEEAIMLTVADGTRPVAGVTVNGVTNLATSAAWSLALSGADAAGGTCLPDGIRRRAQPDAHLASEIEIRQDAPRILHDDQR